MAPLGKTGDTLYYSWDMGKTFEHFKFTDHPISVKNVISEPDATSLLFHVYGRSESDPDTTVIVAVDFSALHERKCEGLEVAGSAHSDYEKWSPQCVSVYRLFLSTPSCNSRVSLFRSAPT